MQDIWWVSPMKGSFDPTKGVMTHRLRATTIKTSHPSSQKKCFCQRFSSHTYGNFILNLMCQNYASTCVFLWSISCNDSGPKNMQSLLLEVIALLLPQQYSPVLLWYHPLAITTTQCTWSSSTVTFGPQCNLINNLESKNSTFVFGIKVVRKENLSMHQIRICSCTDGYMGLYIIQLYTEDSEIRGVLLLFLQR